MEPPKIASTKTVSIKQEPKTSSSLPSGNNNGKVLTTEKVKKEAEKRPADKVRFYFYLVKTIKPCYLYVIGRNSSLCLLLLIIIPKKYIITFQ